MPNTIYNPAAAARDIGITPNTVRLWCKQFAAVLSDSANPPPGQERRLSKADVAILQYVKELRDQQLPLDRISERLQTTDLSLLSIPYIETEIAPIASTIAPTEIMIAINQLSALVASVEALHAKLDAIPDQSSTPQPDRTLQSEIARLRLTVWLLAVGLLVLGAGLAYLLIK